FQEGGRLLFEGDEEKRSQKEHMESYPPYLTFLGYPAAGWNPWELCGPKVKRGDHWDRMRRQGQKVIKWISQLGQNALEDGRAILVDGRLIAHDGQSRLAELVRDGDRRSFRMDKGLRRQRLGHRNPLLEGNDSILERVR
ncbi:hypothetical protein N9L68_07725, partial [bacterium]|nr:hypothetical protein [bacterium]